MKIYSYLISILLALGFFSTTSEAKNSEFRLSFKVKNTVAAQPKYLRFLRYQELMALPKEKQLQYISGLQRIFSDLAQKYPEFSMNSLTPNENVFSGMMMEALQQNSHFVSFMSDFFVQAHAQTPTGIVIPIATLQEMGGNPANFNANFHYNAYVDVLAANSRDCPSVRIGTGNSRRTVPGRELTLQFRERTRYMCALTDIASSESCPTGYREIAGEGGRKGCARRTTGSDILRAMQPQDENPDSPSVRPGTASQPAAVARRPQVPPTPTTPPPSPAAPPAVAPIRQAGAEAPAAPGGGRATGIDGNTPGRAVAPATPPPRSSPAQPRTPTAPSPTPPPPPSVAPPQEPPAPLTPPAPAPNAPGTAARPATEPATAPPASPTAFNDEDEYAAPARRSAVSPFPQNCSEEIYSCESGDEARETNRTAFEQDLSSRGNNCINGANISRYNVTTKTCARVANKTYGDKSFTCTGNQTLCNPLIFGVQSDGQTGICVRLRKNVTLACSAASAAAGRGTSAENVLKFLRDNPSMASAWNEWSQSIERLCQPGTDRNSHRFHCTECTIIFTHLQKLNALTGYANSCGNLLSSLGEGDPMIVNGVIDRSLPGVLQRNPQTPSPTPTPAPGTH